MKLLSLNLWGARQGQMLFDYLQQQAEDTDIFCFQEVFSAPVSSPVMVGKAHMRLFEELKNHLDDFYGCFHSGYGGWVDMKKVDFEVLQGQAIFINKRHKVLNSGSIYIYGNERTKIAENFQNEPKIMQFVEVEAGGHKLLVCNAHGKWHAGDKLDSPDRLKQSEIIRTFLTERQGAKILCGDFNLMPDTESIRMLGRVLSDLIQEYKITNTRNEISWNKYHDRQSFADFTFVSREIKVSAFEVPYNLVSDHLPMILGFNI